MSPISESQEVLQPSQSSEETLSHRNSEGPLKARQPVVQVDVTYESSAVPSSTPEQMVWLAVLRRAIYDFVMYRGYDKKTKQYALAVDAAGWIWWDGEEFGTFLFVCSVLGVNPTQMRRRLLTVKREQLAMADSSKEQ